MPSLPKAGASLELDTSQWDSAYKGAMADAAKLDSLAPTVKVQVSDAELKTAINLAADLDTSTSLKVNVDDSEISTASDQLNDIATIGAIDLAINIAGNAQGLIEGLGRFSGLGGLMEMDSALASIEARTGRMIPGAEKLITDLYVNGWGVSRTEIAGVVAEASQLGLEGTDLEAAVLSTLQVISVTGGEASDTLSKIDIAAKANGISFTESADLFVAGYQNGGDKADDLLDTLSEYGTQFKDFGLSASGALAFLTSGLEAGVFNADTLGDTVKEMGIRFSEIGTTPAITDAFTQLDSLSEIDLSALLEGYEAGTVLGDDMLQGLFDALAEVAETDRTAATLIAAQLVGTTSEIVGPDVWGKLTTDADAALGEIEGRAEDAGNAISDTLGVTVDTFLRGIEQMATDFLSSDDIDLDGKIETFKTQLQTAMSTLAEGGSLGDAIEIGFGIEGFNTSIDRFEAGVGNFLISVLELVAGVQDFLGKDSSGTRAQIATQAAGQFAFDLKSANPEEISTMVQTALDRGVDESKLVDLAGTAVNELIASGDLEQAATVAANLGTEQARIVAKAFGNEVGSLAVPLTADMTPEQIKAATDAALETYRATAPLADLSVEFVPQIDAAGIQTQVDEAIEAAKPAPSEGWWNNLKPPPDLTSTSISKGTGGDAAKTGGWWESIDVSPETIASLDAADEAVVTLDKDVSTAMTNAQLVTGLASDSMIAAVSAMSDGVITADEEIAMAITGNTMTASFDAMSASANQNAEATKASFQGILATVSVVDVAMSAFFNGIMAKVTAVNSAIEGIGTVPTGGGGGGNTTTNTINVSQTTNTQSTAQADAAGYRFAAQIRGMT